ncbi:uncharacterized protein LOC110265574 [Arachis ipaensis]|uniref:uncharacterized protein LOC110265574 n=1 Tax=Arachis ipaensis TaxID=130454 RepID=UPI000A2B2062|nr:uncharacterized protein LOC110265574 [Arachis ipaensis]XP_025628093.1 uncharacterized protein LOC112721237 [Arachis hypogaea]
MERPSSRKEEERTYRPQSKDPKKPFKLTPKFDSYTKFNTKRKDIIKQKLIKPPSKAGTYQDQRYVDRSKHCAFHQKYGHTTDKYVVAKDLLERLARQGLLDKYVSSRNKKETTKDTNRPSHNSDHKDKGVWSGAVESPTLKGVINYILGGFAGRGTTNATRKRSYRAMMTMDGARHNTHTSPPVEQISFNASDLKLQYLNMDDTVVILIHTGELTVKKVLLDPGSSADVLFYSTFKKMQLSNKAQQPSTGELVGFSGKGYLCQDHIMVTVYTNHKDARQCYNACLKIIPNEIIPRVHSVYNTENIPTPVKLDPIDNSSRPSSTDDLEKEPNNTSSNY